MLEQLFWGVTQNAKPGQTRVKGGASPDAPKKWPFLLRIGLFEPLKDLEVTLVQVEHSDFEKLPFILVGDTNCKTEPTRGKGGASPDAKKKWPCPLRKGLCQPLKDLQLAIDIPYKSVRLLKPKKQTSELLELR